MPGRRTEFSDATYVETVPGGVDICNKEDRERNSIIIVLSFPPDGASHSGAIRRISTSPSIAVGAVLLTGSSRSLKRFFVCSSDLVFNSLDIRISFRFGWRLLPASCPRLGAPDTTFCHYE